MKKIILLIFSLMLNACSSMPVSTMAKLSVFGWDDFQAINPEEVEVRITVPQGFELDSKESWIGVDLHSSAGNHYGNFKLDELEAPYLDEIDGFFSSKKVRKYSLKLNESSVGRFNQLKTFILQDKPENVAIKVVPKLIHYPAEAANMEVSIDMQFSRKDGYFTLIDEARLPLDEFRARKES